MRFSKDWGTADGGRASRASRQIMPLSLDSRVRGNDGYRNGGVFIETSRVDVETYGQIDLIKPLDSSSSIKLVSMNSSALRPLAFGLFSAMRLSEFSTPFGLILGIFLCLAVVNR